MGGRAAAAALLLVLTAVATAAPCRYDTDCDPGGAGMTARCDRGACFVHACLEPRGSLAGKVLYIGDSISMSMLKAAGDAGAWMVHAPNDSRYHSNNSRNSVLASQCVATWLQAANPPDCVLINMGLHDIKNDT